ncbi:ABC transporter substrate-binding protein [Niveibacterium terrae]|uniref:ABC transporter substrate-binding protein n=1 Tax=Niveibacterium terrae TaxID=3373598 RepID=UPI003A8FCC8C
MPDPLTRRRHRGLCSLAASALLSLPVVARSADIEVLHWWTAGGEARALAEVVKKMEASGQRWRNFPVAGGGGDNAAIVLKTRVVSGYPPTAAQIKGPEIQEWAAEGYLADLSDIARAGGWDANLPPVVANAMKFGGHYVAAPVNIHRVNWMWANPAVLKKAGVEAPKSWDELIRTADKIQKAGLIPIAHGGQPWQDFTLLESVVLGNAGAAFYRKVFVELDPAAIQSPTMSKSLETFRTLHKYIDSGAPKREWNTATALVINGRAAFQFMGDWAKGEFTRAGKQPGRDFLCLAAPGTDKAFSYNIDSFVFFRRHHEDARKAQTDLANALMGTSFQESFNLAKGSIPARSNVRLDHFDDCARHSAEAFRASSQGNSLVPSIAHNMAVAPSVQAAMETIVSTYFNGSQPTREAQALLADAARNRKARN